MNKKLLYVTLSLLMIFTVGVLVNCGGSDDAAGPAPLPTAIKSTVTLTTLLTDGNYKFLHGSTSPDGTKQFLVVNKAATPNGVTTGVADLYIVDAVKLTQGEVVKLLGPVSIGNATTTPLNVTFRSNWTADGTKIMLAGGDRFWVINAADLTSLNGADGVAALNGSAYFHSHDALATTDGKYALLTLRTKPYTAVTDSTKLDGEIKLYDLTTNAVVGAGVSVCNDCHGQTTPKNATLCGIDGKLEKQANGTYTGTVYVAGHGGHIAKAVVTITPSNTTTPIAATVSSLVVAGGSASKFQAGTAAAAASVGTSQYKLHDVRLAGNTLYWSTYNTDINSVAHYGTYDLTTGTVVDNTEAIPSTVTSPAAGVDKMPIYCGSGLTPKAFMPMTMTYPAYITVIPR